ncbi:MAG: GGDEF domain-containing protein [Gemmatimonadales bacterium]|jgi:PleD family two-component response regulator
MTQVRERFPPDAAETVSLRGPATVTVITTDETLLPALSGVLQTGDYRLEQRTRPEPLGRFLDDRRSDAVLLDLRWLPVSTRIEIGRQLRATRRRPTIPLIGICDDRLSLEGRTTALGDGFWDVIELPGQAAELAAKLGTWIWLKRDVDGIQSGMLLDIKTGHYTALGIKRRLRELVALARRMNDPLACIVFGVDLSPDEVRNLGETLYDLELKFSLALHHGTRNSDVVGHLEFLKFMVLAPHTPSAGGLRLAERFTSLSLSKRVDGEFPATLSAGVAGIAGRNGQVQACPELMLAAASRALNSARAAGTAQVAGAWG